MISLFSALGALSVARMTKRHNAFFVLLLMMLAVLLTLGAMILQTVWFLYLAIIPSSIAFGYIVTLKNIVIQKRIGSRHQATAVSISTFVRSLSFTVAVVGLGVVLDYSSASDVNSLLLASAAIFTIPFIISTLKRITI